MLHNMTERHHPKLRGQGNSDWYEIALDRMSERLLQQSYKLKVPLKNSAVSGIAFTCKLFVVLYYNVLHCIVLYYIVLYCIVLYCIVLYCIVL